MKDRDDSIGELLEASELGGNGSGALTPTKQMEIINKLKERLKERDKAVEVSEACALVLSTQFGFKLFAYRRT